MPRLNSIALLLALAAVVLFGACSVNVDKNKAGKDQKVDIKTPFGNIKVNNEANANDTGLPLYAGARQMPTEKGNDANANVNIEGPFGGVKVAVAKYESDDAPDKVLTYYRDQMKTFGKVVECKGETDQTANPHGDDDRDEPVTCGHQDPMSKTIALKTGTTHKQHVVAVKPRGSGSEIDLIYVKVRGKDDAI